MARNNSPLEVYLLTFNCARTLIDPTLLGADFFSAWPRSRAQLPDVVAISLQEVAPIAYSFLGESWLSPYLERVEESLQGACKKYGHEAETYDLVSRHSVGMTAAMVFVRGDLRSRTGNVRTAGVGVGVWEMGNKGGVGIRFEIDDEELTFVAMHLAPMEGEVQRRNQDWQDICQGLIFESVASKTSGASSGTESEPLLSRDELPLSGLYDTKGHIFLFGDLNYRTSHLAPTVTAYKSFPQPAKPSSSISDNNRIAVAELLARDQLTQERQENRVLQGFSEAPITFPPTYKYSHTLSKVPGPQAAKDESTTEDDVEEAIVQEPSTWSWARHRWPSWCDRILFYPPSGVETGKYTALPLQPTSDHRPVALHVTIKPSRTVDNDLRRAPPFQLDQHWQARRATARRYELVVGMASWVTLTVEGQSTVAGLIGGALAVYFLISVFGQSAG